MKEQLEAELKSLKAQERNRILIISGLMVAGAATGFLISRKMKARTVYQILSTVGASFAFGLPYLLATNKKSKERKEKIKVSGTALNLLNSPVKATQTQPTAEELKNIQQTLKIGGLIK